MVSEITKNVILCNIVIFPYYKITDITRYYKPL